MTLSPPTAWPIGVLLMVGSLVFAPKAAQAQYEQGMSLNGSRLTYYAQPDANQCFAACANNGACQGATWIQAGTYNPRDAAMCYLMSTVSGKSPARGHYSMVKRGPAGGGPPPLPQPPRPTGPNDFSPADIGTI